MNRQNIKLALFFIIGLLTAFLVMYFIQNYRIEKKNTEVSTTEITSNTNSKAGNSADFSTSSSGNSANIDELTNENKVINYVKSNKNLPDYYVTKSEAKETVGFPLKEIYVMFCPEKQLAATNSATEKKISLETANILKPT